MIDTHAPIVDTVINTAIRQAARAMNDTQLLSISHPSACHKACAAVGWSADRQPSATRPFGCPTRPHRGAQPTRIIAGNESGKLSTANVDCQVDEMSGPMEMTWQPPC